MGIRHSKFFRQKFTLSRDARVDANSQPLEYFVLIRHAVVFFVFQERF